MLDTQLDCYVRGEQVASLRLFSISTQLAYTHTHTRDSLSVWAPEARVAPHAEGFKKNGPKIKCCCSTAVTPDIACQKFSFTGHGQHGGQKSKYNGPNHPSFFLLLSADTELRNDRRGWVKTICQKNKRCRTSEGKEKKYLTSILSHFFSGGCQEHWDCALTAREAKGQKCPQHHTEVGTNAKLWLCKQKSHLS